MLLNKTSADLIQRIIESKSARMAGSIIRASYGDVIDTLAQSGLLTKVGQTDVVPAEDGYEDKPVRVDWSPEHESHGYLGARGQWVSVAAEEITLYGVKMTSFLSHILVRCERVSISGINELIPDLLWDLGDVKLDGRGKPVSIWFARRLFDAERCNKVEALSAKRPPNNARVIITLTDRGVDKQATDQIVVALRDIADPVGYITIDPRILAKRLKLAPASMQKPIRHSDDFGHIYIGDDNYVFTGPTQRAILKILVEAYNSGKPTCLTSSVLSEVEAGRTVTNLARAFSKNKYWKVFIREKDGRCWIEI